MYVSSHRLKTVGKCVWYEKIYSDVIICNWHYVFNLHAKSLRTLARRKMSCPGFEILHLLRRDPIFSVACAFMFDSSNVSKLRFQLYRIFLRYL